MDTWLAFTQYQIPILMSEVGHEPLGNFITGTWTENRTAAANVLLGLLVSILFLKLSERERRRERERERGGGGDREIDRERHTHTKRERGDRQIVGGM